MTNFAELKRSKHVSIESYRRNGAPVRTAVWITAEQDKLYCWTITDTGKVKRIGRDPRVRLAVCTARGAIRSDWVDGAARILANPEDIARQTRRMRAKYGLLFLPFEWMPRLSRTPTCVIEISISG